MEIYVIETDNFNEDVEFANLESALNFIRDQVKMGYSCRIDALEADGETDRDLACPRCGTFYESGEARCNCTYFDNDNPRNLHLYRSDPK